MKCESRRYNLLFFFENYVFFSILDIGTFMKSIKFVMNMKSGMKGEFYKKFRENTGEKSYAWFDYAQVG